MIGFIKSHVGSIVGVFLAVIASAYFVGCQPTTSSVVEKGVKVNASQLEAEKSAAQTQADVMYSSINKEVADFQSHIETEKQKYTATVTDWNNRFSIGEKDIENKLAQRQQIMNVLGGAAKLALEGTIDPVSAVGSIFTLITMGLAGGALTDSARKSAVVAKPVDSAGGVKS